MSNVASPEWVSLPRIDTKDAAGNFNGWVVPIWRADSFVSVSQVYLTAVMPGCVKGPHLHKRRTGRFMCVGGRAEVLMRNGDGGYIGAILSEATPAVLVIPPYMAAQIRCLGNRPAMILNMPDPAWSAADPDEWPVDEWEPPGCETEQTSDAEIKTIHHSPDCQCDLCRDSEGKQRPVLVGTYSIRRKSDE